jgi:hypothetical protein
MILTTAVAQPQIPFALSQSKGLNGFCGRTRWVNAQKKPFMVRQAHHERLFLLLLG